MARGMGESAGRSAGNPTNGRRRFSPDERAQRTHLRDDPQAWPEDPARIVRRRLSWAVVVTLVALAVLTASLVLSVIGAWR